MTVDTAHVLVDAHTTRESLYVAATRSGRGARLYVTNEDLIGIDAERPPAPALGARDILTEALHRESGERSATEVRRSEHATPSSTHHRLPAQAGRAPENRSSHERQPPDSAAT